MTRRRVPASALPWTAIAAAAVLAAIACGRHPRAARTLDLDAAAESYVRLVLALGERDADSLDSYSGPAVWQAEARRRRAPLDEIQRDAHVLVERLAASAAADEVRRGFVVRQLRALAARIEILRGARPGFADEARQLFDLEVGAAPPTDVAAVHRALDHALPGRGALTPRVAAFDRRFVIAPERLPRVMARAVAECRDRTAAHVELPAGEAVEIGYVPDLAWSAVSRYRGGFRSTIRINASLPLTVDRALDLACHEAYPGHHLISTLLERRFTGRVELRVQAAFSPQSLLHESAASNAAAVVFSDRERETFERDVLFPLAGLDRRAAVRYVRIARLVDRLHGAEGAIVGRYLDGALDFPRASTALERDALMPSADIALKFVNRFRTYAATYTFGRDRFWARLTAMTNGDDPAARWRAYVALVTDPAQRLPPADARQ